jgi:hypothetical protein
LSAEALTRICIAAHPAYGGAANKGDTWMKAALSLLPLALLAACDSSPKIEAKNASVAEVAAKVREAGADTFLRPGKWLTKATLEEFSMHGMPPGMADNMKMTMASKPGSESCLTEADAKKPNADFFNKQSENCRYDHYTMGGGKIDAKMRCTAGGGTQLMTMAGDYSPDEYHMHMNSQMELGQAAAARGMGAMTMKLRVEGKRIGDCDKGQG